MLLLAGCKQPGTIVIDVDLPSTCDTPDNVGIYLVQDFTCDGCDCGECFGECNADNCVQVCGGELCDAADLAAGIDFDPPRPGLFAVIYEYFENDALGTPRLSATACEQIVLDADGTASSELSPAAVCCP